MPSFEQIPQAPEPRKTPPPPMSEAMKSTLRMIEEQKLKKSTETAPKTKKTEEDEDIWSKTHQAGVSSDRMDRAA